VIYTVSCRDKEKARDVDSKDFQDRKGALLYYKHLFEKYGDSKRFEVSLDIGFGKDDESGEGEQDANAELPGDDTDNQ
jgi:hypothetical protein